MRDSAIDHDAVKKASGILERILTEEPEFWPYGLSVDQFDGGLYMLSKSANSKDYIGFVGWQEREEAGKTVGYYAIGVLPEYRRQGLAKAAVQKLLREKSAGVDEVRALVMSHNTPSQQLARSIPGVKLTIFEKLASIEKSAGPVNAASSAAQKVNKIKILNLLAPTLGAVTAHTTFDQMADTNRTLESTFRPDTWGDDKMRKLLAVLNLAGGAGAGLMAIRGGQPATYAAPLFLSLPVKDLAMKGIGTLHKADDLAAATQKALQQPKAGVPKSVLYGMLGLGAGALGRRVSRQMLPEVAASRLRYQLKILMTPKPCSTFQSRK
jgi:RimJ/RimL family protein N-acetyltransferase